MRHKSLKQVLARQSSQFERLIDKVTEIKHLNEVLYSFLDPLLIPHCQVANFREGCLVIMANSAAWATRLRYDFPDLLSRFRYEARLFNILSLHCVVRKICPSAEPLTHSPLKLSSENAKIFEELSQEESDPILAAALKKLAGRGSHL